MVVYIAYYIQLINYSTRLWKKFVGYYYYIAVYCKRHSRVSFEGRRSHAYFASPYHSCTWQIVIIIKTARVAVPIYYNIYGSRWSSISTVLEGVHKKKNVESKSDFYTNALLKDKTRLNSRSAAFIFYTKNMFISTYLEYLNTRHSQQFVDK